MKNMIRRILCREDGVTIIMVLAFMALSVPIVTAALGLASTLSIDSRVKGDIARNQFSDIGANELAIQRLTEDVLPGPDGNGIPDLLEEDTDGDGTPDIWEDEDGDGEPDGHEEIVTINDDDIVINITPDLPAPLETPKADGLVVTKTLLDFSPNPVPAYDSQTGWAHYEIVIANTNAPGTAPIELRRVFDGLPLNFQYKGSSKLDGHPIGQPEIVDTFVLDPAEGQLLFDETNPTLGVREMLTWNIFEEEHIEVMIEAGHSVTLTFKAKFDNLPDGAYCNVAWTEPEDSNSYSRTGMAAPVFVGTAVPGDPCLGNQVAIITNATAILNPNEVPLNPDDDVEITYNIIIQNNGATDLSMWALRDKLPPGFQYMYGSTSGDITSTDPGLNSPGLYSRTRMLWFWSVIGSEILIPAGTEKTLTFKALAPRDSGLYRNEIWAFFTEFDGYPTAEEQRAYSWPSSPIYLADVFEVKLNGVPTSKVWVIDGQAIVRRWNIN